VEVEVVIGLAEAVEPVVIAATFQEKTLVAVLVPRLHLLLIYQQITL
jgi:hypothetical protein